LSPSSTVFGCDGCVWMVLSLVPRTVSDMQEGPIVSDGKSNRRQHTRRDWQSSVLKARLARKSNIASERE
jgi:hypothetical protein